MAHEIIGDSDEVLAAIVSILEEQAGEIPLRTEIYNETTLAELGLELVAISGVFDVIRLIEQLEEVFGLPPIPADRLFSRKGNKGRYYPIETIGELRKVIDVWRTESI